MGFRTRNGKTYGKTRFIYAVSVKIISDPASSKGRATHKQKSVYGEHIDWLTRSCQPMQATLTTYPKSRSFACYNAYKAKLKG